jgi:hypothetical protein
MVFHTSHNGTLTEHMRLTSSGLLGLSVNPSGALLDKLVGATGAAQYERATGLAHGMTSIYPTDVYFVIDTFGSGSTRSYGGAKLTGLSTGAGYTGLTLQGFGAIPAVVINGAVPSGTSVTDVGATDALLSIQNNTTEKAHIHGDGSMVIETTKRVACGGGSTGSTTAANGTVTLEINGVSYYLLRAAAA